LRTVSGIPRGKQGLQLSAILTLAVGNNFSRRKSSVKIAAATAAMAIGRDAILALIASKCARQRINGLARSAGCVFGPGGSAAGPLPEWGLRGIMLARRARSCSSARAGRSRWFRKCHMACHNSLVHLHHFPVHLHRPKPGLPCCDRIQPRLLFAAGSTLRLRSVWTTHRHRIISAA
jgi:hypothetical protein